MSVLHDVTKAAALVASSAAAILVAGPLAAKDAPVVVRADPTTIRSEHVSFAGMDLSTARDARKLRLKVAGAVKRVCLFDHGRAKLQASDYYPCADGAWESAQPQLDRALSGASAIASNSITVTAFGG